MSSGPRLLTCGMAQNLKTSGVCRRERYSRQSGMCTSALVTRWFRHCSAFSLHHRRFIQATVSPAPEAAHVDPGSPSSHLCLSCAKSPRLPVTEYSFHTCHGHSPLASRQSCPAITSHLCHVEGGPHLLRPEGSSVDVVLEVVPDDVGLLQEEAHRVRQVQPRRELPHAQIKDQLDVSTHPAIPAAPPCRLRPAPPCPRGRSLRTCA